MAAKSNTGFYHEYSVGSSLNRHAISFQSSAMDSTTEMIMMGNYYGVNITSEGTMFLGNSSSNTRLSAPQATSTSTSLLLDSVPGLKHEAGLAVEWSVEEQYRLEEGLAKYADEPNILRYIRIASMLHDKTVRDVALRCRWMTDKLMESSLNANIPSVKPLNVAAYSHTRNYQNGSDRMSREALDGARRLLEQNNEVLRHISANLSTFKLQENIDLFLCARNNITTILNLMSTMRGVMGHMPPLPLSINEELANSILPSTVQRMMFAGLPSGIHLKQEPGC